MRLGRLRIVFRAIGALAALAPLAVYSVPLAWDLTAGLDYSDNVTRSPVPQSDTIAEAGLDFAAHNDDPRLKLDLVGNAQYQDYLQHTYPNALVGAAVGALDYFFIPERFSWVVDDNFGQIANNSLQVENPGNRQFINRADTGPDLTIPFNARNQLLLQGRATDVSFQGDANGNGNRQFSGMASLAHLISKGDTISLNFSQVHVEYGQHSQYTNYDIQEAFARWALVAPKTTLTVDLGYTELKDLGVGNSGTAARLTLARKVSLHSTVQVQAGSEFSDASGILQVQQSFEGISLANIQGASVNDPVHSKFAMASWSTAGVRSGVQVAVTWREEHHEMDALFDQTLKTVSADFTHQLSPRLSGQLTVQYIRDDFAKAQVNSSEWEFDGRLGFRMTRQLSLTVIVNHYQGRGFLGEAQPFQENRVFAGVTWSGQPR